jgi:hypothetical protein
VITVTIAGMPVEGGKASEGWINQMIAEARKTGLPVCVRVEIKDPSANVNLATQGCGSGGGGGRPPNELERRIIDAWNARGLASGSFSPGQLRAFLNEAARLI